MEQKNQQPNQQKGDITKKIMAIVKAIAYAENGGKMPKEAVAGKTGEMKSIFQFTPDTWKMYSKQVLGKEEPLTSDNESLVVYGKVGKWLDDGYNTEQIASMWNAGEQRPDAYKQNWKGTNKKYGVSFDTPAYAKKVADYAKQFEFNTGVTTSETGVQNPLQSQIAQTEQKPKVVAQTTPQPTLPELMRGQMKQNQMKQPKVV